MSTEAIHTHICNLWVSVCHEDIPILGKLSIYNSNILDIPERVANPVPQKPLAKWCTGVIENPEQAAFLCPVCLQFTNMPLSCGQQVLQLTTCVTTFPVVLCLLCPSFTKSVLFASLLFGGFACFGEDSCISRLCYQSNRYATLH